MKKFALRSCLIATAAALFFSSISRAQQVADPNFDAKVAHPAYTKNGPKVLFDEAHKNFSYRRRPLQTIR